MGIKQKTNALLSGSEGKSDRKEGKKGGKKGRKEGKRKGKKEETWFLFFQTLTNMAEKHIS